MSGKIFQILSPAEIGDLRSEKKILQATLQAVEDDGYGAGTSRAGIVDKEFIKKQMTAIDDKIKKGMPKKVSSSGKDKLVKEAKRLRDLITDGMPTYNEMWPTRGQHPGATLKHLNWEKRCGPLVTQYKQIMRRLEPDNPAAGNIEDLRRR